MFSIRAFEREVGMYARFFAKWTECIFGVYIYVCSCVCVRLNEKMTKDQQITHSFIQMVLLVT